MKVVTRIIIFIAFSYNLLGLNATFIEILPYSDPNQCNRSEYFDGKLLKCTFCDYKKYLISTTDKEKCTCNERSNSVYDSSKLFSLHCEKCKSNTIFSKEINSCIKCSNGVFKKDNVTQCRICKENEIIVYHTRNGTILNQTRCLLCTNGMIPSADSTKCIPCPIFNPIKVNGTIKCMCDYKSVRLGNLCIASTLFPDLTNNKKKYFLQYHTGEKINSQLFDEHLKLNIYLCKLQNSSACQILANFCTLTLFTNYENSPCNLWLDKYLDINLDNKLPWLLYREGDASIVLNRKTISAEYSLDSLSIMSRLNLTAAIFYINGTLKEVKQLLGSDINLCPDLDYLKNNALRFGINYYYECSVDARQFFNDRKTEFIVPYLQYLENGKPMLYALPVLIRNLSQYKNNEDDMTTWLLVRRFFMFDTISSIGTESDEPSLLRYVKSLQIKVKLRSGEHNGLIYPPLIVLEYGEISEKQYCHGERIKFQISASYEMKSNMRQSIEIAVGVLSTLAAVYSGIQTWSYSKRSGKIAIDIVTLIRLCIFLCGNLANSFFVVAFGVSVHTFIFYKGQSVVHLLLPTSDEEDIIRRYIIVAFALKIIEITDLIWHQITTDIFLIDWERPRPQDTIPRPKSKSSPFTLTSSSYTQQSVSIWRSYFIANEWNEIQTKRKVNLLIHMLAIAFLLKVVGVEFWGTADPELHTTMPNHLKNVPLSFICRFAVGCLVYVTVYLIQLILMVVLYERYIQNAIQQFVDVCSLTNISVFIFSLERYGYYIHGRSSHGFADTDMSTMIKQLKREEDDLCAYRGLLPGTHHQTFSVAVPAKLRLYYNKLMIPTKTNTTNGHNMNLIDVSPNKSSTNMKTDNFDKIIQAYHNVNKFLSAFLEHALKDLDYDIKDRLFIESLLDIEFTDCLDRGILLTDSGHSFDNILFYGNEFCLFTFDIMLFSCALMLSDDFVLTILLTLCISEILKIIRKIGGKRNLAQKTLIDERFLI